MALRALVLVAAVLICAIRATAAEVAHDQAFASFAQELKQACDPDDVERWGGGRASGEVRDLLRANHGVALDAYVEAGLQQMRGYPERDYRLNVYWYVFVLAAVLDHPEAGRAQINRLLARADAPIRVKGWVLHHLHALAGHGASLSWLEPRTMQEVISEFLAEPVFLLRQLAAMRASAPGDRPLSQRRDWDVDSDALAACLIRSYGAIEIDQLADALIGMEPGQVKLRAEVVSAAKAVLPAFAATCAVRAGALAAVRARRAIGLGPEQARALVRSHVACCRADPAELARLAGVTMELIDETTRQADRVAQAAIAELAQSIATSLRDGAFVRAPGGMVVEHGGEGPSFRERIRAVVGDPGAGEVATPAAFQAWLIPLMTLHAESPQAAAMPAGQADWQFALKTVSTWSPAR